MTTLARQAGLAAVALGCCLAAALSGCLGPDRQPHGTGLTTPAGEDWPICFHRRGTYCGVRDRLRVVVRDEAHMAMLPVPAVPVDFGRQMVLFVTLGRVYSGRYAVRIDRVWREGRLIKVAIEEIYPTPGDAGPPRPCSPYDLVVVPRSDLNVEGFVTEIPAGALAVPALQP